MRALTRAVRSHTTGIYTHCCCFSPPASEGPRLEKYTDGAITAGAESPAVTLLVRLLLTPSGKHFRAIIIEVCSSIGDVYQGQGGGEWRGEAMLLQLDAMVNIKMDALWWMVRAYASVIVCQLRRVGM